MWVTKSDPMETRLKKKHSVEAVADIRNATNFDVSLEASGVKLGLDLGRLGFLTGPVLKSRSFAIMCEADDSDRQRKKYRALNYGKRIDGDFLVRFERHQVMRSGSQFPSHTFDFFDGGVDITYVELKIDVSGNNLECDKQECNFFTFSRISFCSRQQPQFSPIKSYWPGTNSMLGFMEPIIAHLPPKCAFMV